MLENLHPPAPRQGRCRVRTVASELDLDDSQRLWDAINDSNTWSAYALSSSLSKLGLRISVNSILRHRNGGCSC